MPTDEVPNLKAYTVPEGSPRARKGSTFTDMLSRNKKVIPGKGSVNVKPASNLRKPSIIMEEVRQEQGQGFI